MPTIACLLGLIFGFMLGRARREPARAKAPRTSEYRNPAVDAYLASNPSGERDRVGVCPIYGPTCPSCHPPDVRYGFGSPGAEVKPASG